MFCPKCGEENDKDGKFCSSCGVEIKVEKEKAKRSEDNDSEIKEPKVNSILALIFGIILPPVGLILSIIGLVRSSKYKKKAGKSSSYVSLNIVGLILSILGIFILIFVALLVGKIALLFFIQKDIWNDTWNCKKNIFDDSYITQVEFDDDRFIWGKYDDVSNNNYKGTYKINGIEYKNGKYKYNTTFYLKTKKIDGVTSLNDNDIKMTITYDKNNLIISSEDNETYYCTRED